MRTKTLLLAAAMFAAGLAISSAQNVYSQNVVGYVNQVIPPGFSMIANQLDTGTNTLGNLLPNPPTGTIVYKFAGAGYAPADVFFGTWGDPTVTLNPGEGAFIFNPTASPITNAFIGTVWQGTNNVTVPAGFSMQSYLVPIVGGISSTSFPYPAITGDIIYLWNVNSNAFDTYIYFGGWTPQEPIINVGQAFFIYRDSLVGTNWGVTFTVGQ